MEYIKNLSAYAYLYKWIVARECDDGLWFWGAWDNYEDAYHASCEVGGILIRNPEVE